MKKIFIVILCLMLCLTVASCLDTTGQGDQEGLKVYASFYTMYDFACKIGGDAVTVANLVPAGMEPHSWEPSTGDMVKLRSADVLIYNGGGMESWIGRVLDSNPEDGFLAVETARDLIIYEFEEDHDHDSHGHGDFDPHVWLNPSNAKRQAEVILEAFCQADPGNAQLYGENYNSFSQELDQLDNAYREAMSSFTRNEIVVAHEAYGYLCDAYGLTQIAIEGLSADSEPSPARMTEIIDFINENKIEYIFVEELASTKAAERIASETGAVLLPLNPLEGLTDEELSGGEDYLSVMYKNLEMLKEALA